MHISLRAIMAAIAVALVLALASAATSARNLSLSHTGFRLTTESFEIELSGAGTVRCPITMEGSLHSRTLTKTAGSLIGYLTRTSLGSCSNGTARVLTETLPWHLRYDSFTGSLPNITQVRTSIVGASISATPSGFVTCLLRSDDREPFFVGLQVETGGRWDVWISVGDNEPIPVIGTFCELVRGFFRGTGRATVAGETASITVTLI